jgi:hypothetical protein
MWNEEEQDGTYEEEGLGYGEDELDYGELEEQFTGDNQTEEDIDMDIVDNAANNNNTEDGEEHVGNDEERTHDEHQHQGRLERNNTGMTQNYNGNELTNSSDSLRRCARLALK